MFEIERNIPAPKRAKRREWPWGDMNVGDSVLIKPTEEEPNLPLHARNAVHVYAAYKPKKFTTRQEGKNMRIWRVE